MNNKGFTLVEALAVIVLLGIVLSIGGYSVANYLGSSKEKSLDVFKDNIKSGMINCYNECRYLRTDVCESVGIVDNTLTISLGELVDKGFLENQSDGEGGSLEIKNPINEEEKLTNCGISITYDSNTKEFSDVTYDSSCGSLETK